MVKNQEQEVIFEFPAYHDPWMDNGLELFYLLVKNYIEKQFPEVVQIFLEPDRILLKVKERECFLALLKDALEEYIKSYLFYFSERSGERRQALKPFVGFNRQPRSQHPPLYQSKRVDSRYPSEKLPEFLSRVFPSIPPQGRGGGFL